MTQPTPDELILAEVADLDAGDPAEVTRALIMAAGILSGLGHRRAAAACLIAQRDQRMARHSSVSALRLVR